MLIEKVMKSILLHAVIYIIVTTTLIFSKDTINISNAVMNEINKCPELQIQDLYKLAYQASMGNKHILTDTSLAYQYLIEEINAIDADSTEPLIEYLTSDSAIARVNLRPFKSAKLDPELLFEAMVKSAEEHIPSIELLRQFLNDIESLAMKNKIPFEPKAIKMYFEQMEKQNFPIMHHSNTMMNSCKPAYRVIISKYFHTK